MALPVFAGLYIYICHNIHETINVAYKLNYMQ